MSLYQVLDTAIKIDGAAKGNVQVINRELGGLQIIAQNGFNQAFLQLFELVRIDHPTSCARAFRSRQRVVIPDISKDALCAPYYTICKANGFQAVQSTPIVGRNNFVKGILTTFFENVHHLSEEGAKGLDDCASELARLIVEP